MAIKGGRIKSVQALKASTEKRGANESFLQRVPSDGSITVQFLTEPDGWFNFFEHYDAVRKYYPCDTDGCPGCAEGDKPSQRYLANALRIEDSRVIPMVMATSLVSKLVRRYDKYGTILDRPYELIREGSGFDTEYDCNPEAPRRFDASRYEKLDLAEVLENQLKRAFQAEDGDDLFAFDEEDEPKKGTAELLRQSKAKKIPVVEPEDDEDEDDPEPDDTEVTREDAEMMSLRELRQFAKERGLAPTQIRGLDQDALLDLIFADKQDEAVEDDEDEDDGEVVPEPDVEDDDDDDELEEITEDKIREMPLQGLRAFAKINGVKVLRTDGKGVLAQKVIDHLSNNEPPF